MHDSPQQAKAAAPGLSAAQETRRQRIRLLIRAAGMLARNRAALRVVSPCGETDAVFVTPL
jgi:hypothetical protein